MSPGSVQLNASAVFCSLWGEISLSLALLLQKTVLSVVVRSSELNISAPRYSKRVYIGKLKFLNTLTSTHWACNFGYILISLNRYILNFKNRHCLRWGFRKINEIVGSHYFCINPSPSLFVVELQIQLQHCSKETSFQYWWSSRWLSTTLYWRRSHAFYL
jgi:hypothetical protein